MALSSSADRRRRSRQSGEEGFTLIELMMAIVVIAVAFVALVGGMMAAITAADFHRKEATADSLIRSAAETLVDPQLAYKPCAGTGGYSSALPSATGFSVSYSIEYWLTGKTPAFTPIGCTPPPASNDTRLQQITITVTSNSTGVKVTERLMVIKRNQ